MSVRGSSVAITRQNGVVNMSTTPETEQVPVFSTRDLAVYYGDFRAVRDVNVDINVDFDVEFEVDLDVDFDFDFDVDFDVNFECQI